MSATVAAGQPGSYLVKINRTTYTGRVLLSISGAPAGTTSAFNANPTTANSSTLTVTTSINTPVGSYQLKIDALEADTKLKAAPIYLMLIVNPPPTVRLLGSPSSQSILAGSRAVYYISFDRANFTGNVNLRVDNPPPNVTISISNNGPNHAEINVQTNFGMGNAQVDLLVSGTANGALVLPVSLRLRTNCNFQWAHQIPGGGGDYPFDITTDRFGNVIVVGKRGEYYADDGSQRAFVAKYFSNGTLAWSREVDSSGRGEDEALSVITDNDGNVYVGGKTTGKLQEDLPDTPNTPPSNWWLAKFDNNGLYYWVRQDPTRLYTNLVKLALSSSGNINLYALGWDLHKASFDINGQMLSHTTVHTSGGGDARDMEVSGDFLYTTGVFSSFNPDTNSDRPAFLRTGVVEKYNLNGSLIWSRSFKVAGEETRSNSLAVDAAGNVFIGGRTDPKNVDLRFPWLRKFNSSGQLVWELKLPINEEEVTALTMHSDGNLLATGRAWYRGKGTWLSKYRASNGVELWQREIDWKHGNYIWDIHSDTGGNIYLTGSAFDFAASNIWNLAKEVWTVKYSEQVAVDLPRSLVVFQPTVAQGDVVSLRGINLAGVEEIRVGDLLVNFTVVSSSEIRITIPNLAPGDHPLTVRACCEIVKAELPLTVL